MTQELFDVYLTGEILPGHNRTQVAERLAQRVNVATTRADVLLGGKPTRMKQGIDRSTASRYQQALVQTGAGALIRQQGHTGTVAEGAPARLNPARINAESGDSTQPMTEFDKPRRRPLKPVPVIGWVAAGLIVVLGVIWFGLPSPQAVRSTALVGETLNLAQTYQQQVEDYWRQHHQLPARLQDLQLASAPLLGDLATLTLGAEGTLVIHFTASPVAGETLELAPTQTDQGIQWQCGGGSLNLLDRPLECQVTDIQALEIR